MPDQKEAILEKRRDEDRSQELLKKGWYHSFNLPGIGVRLDERREDPGEDRAPDGLGWSAPHEPAPASTATAASQENDPGARCHCAISP